MKTLLAIVNAPKESIEFLRYVAGMAVNLAAKVKVLYVHTPPNYPYGLAASVDVASLQVEENLKELIEETDKILEKDIDEITKEIQSPVFTGFSSEIGLTTTVAKKFVSGEKIDMVLLEGQQDYGFWMQSPTNLDVISVLECPVWIIPKGAIYLPFSEIVYATDYNEEDIINLKKLISLFPHLEPNITALHITDSVDFEERVKKEGFLEMLQSKTSYKNLTVKTVHKSKDDETIQLVNDFALSNRADLLVMLKENKSFIDRIFTKNQTKETLKTTDLPLLVYHEKE